MKNWSSVALGDIFDIARGGSPRPIQSFITSDSDGINWIMIGDASDNSRYITSTKKRIIRSGVSKSRMVNPGDFLLTNSMSFGHPYILKTSGCIHDGWLVLSAKKNNIDQNYFFHLLGSNTVYREFSRRAAGTTVKNLNIDLVRGVEVSLPSLEEQKRIAAILDKADAIRRKRKEAIALTEELLRSTFLNMFGDPITNPKGWDEVFLGDISKIQGGLQVTSKRKDHPMEIPYLRVANVYRDRLVLDEIKTIRVTQQEAERTYLQTGDLLIVEGHGNSTEIGRSSVWDGSIPNCSHQNHLICVRTDIKKADSMYVSIFLNSPGGRRQLNRFGKTTSGLNTISTSNVKETKVLLPPLSEQEKFIKIREVIVKSLNNHRGYLSSLENLFNSLLQKAFRGEL